MRGVRRRICRNLRVSLCTVATTGKDPIVGAAFNATPCTGQKIRGRETHAKQIDLHP
jgi:hypothetical protein